jgi:cytochrome P450
MSAAELFALDPAAVACPHVALRALQEEGPAVWVDEIQAYAVTRHDDVMHVARHPELFSSRLATGPVMARQMLEAIGAAMADDRELHTILSSGRMQGSPAVLLNADPPAHTRQRALVNRAFTLRRVREREAEVAAVADALIDRFAGRGEVELIHEFAVPLPLTVIAQMLGVPLDRMDDFKRWSDDFVVAIGNHHLTKSEMGRMLRSQAEFFEYFAEQIEDRRSNPRDDVVTDVVESRIDGEELSVPEMLSMFSQFLVAGNETTTKLIGSAVLHLVTHPDTADRLRADPDAIFPFVEEMLRLHAPVQGLFRVANRDTEVGGVPIPARAAVWLVYAAANRDPSHVEAPEECRLDRHNSAAHLSFGFGEHFCLGASLARVETRIGLRRLLERLDDVRLVCEESELQYEPSYVLHGLQALPLRFTGRRQ